MKTRSLKVLYTILLESLKSDRERTTCGVCGETMYLRDSSVITRSEEEKLDYHFSEQHPSKNSRFSKFMKHPLWTGDSYWFVPMYRYGIVNKEAVQVRIELVTAILKHIQR